MDLRKYYITLLIINLKDIIYKVELEGSISYIVTYKLTKSI
jgi:hypothetical protein